MFPGTWGWICREFKVQRWWDKEKERGVEFLDHQPLIVEVVSEGKSLECSCLGLLAIVEQVLPTNNN